MPETAIENRITFSYGVNKNQRRSGFSTHKALQERVESETSGPVQIDKRESRMIYYEDWEEV